MKVKPVYIATAIALLFHLSGVIGILWSAHADWFIRHTPLNLLLMALLLIWVQPDKSWSFWLFTGMVFVVGMGAEITGVQTGNLFGSYHYGSIMGWQFAGVPLLIGINWVVVILCCAGWMQLLHGWAEKKLGREGAVLPPRLASLSWVLDGALLAVFFDWVMEPVALKLGFWTWSDAEIPVYNYSCWFLLSAALLYLNR
ncbi:MAG TPA: carotenoid biosynthesis protein, partial [Sediminibacterium sp.]|nr:carotenoid biosynthesis protein [Sediminibacterium sp.]